MKKIFTLLFLSTVSVIGFGQRLMTENFDYSTGGLTTAGTANVSGGNWVTNTGTGNFLQVTAGNLSYPNYITSPAPGSNKLSTVATSSSAEDTYRAFAAQTSGTVYGSVLVSVNDISTLLANTDANGDYHIAFLPTASTSTYTDRVSFRKGTAANTFNIGIRSHTTTPMTTAWAPADYTTGTYLIIFSYTFVAGASNDVVKLWVNPAYSATEPAALVTTDFTGGTEPADISRVAIRQGTTTPGTDIDAIKVSTSWSDVALPLNLLSFNAALNNNTVNLSWATTNEVNTAGFEIQRSANGKDFNTISVVSAKGALFANNYTLVDEKAFGGTNYYRLKMSDKDGSFRYSQIVTVKTKSVGVGVYPNPVKSELTIQHEAGIKGASISIVNFEGKQVLNTNVQIGAIQTSLDASKLAPGTYMVIYNNNGERTTKQFVKQ
jgi:hypothetical protein